MLPHTTFAVSAFPEDDVQSSHSVCVYNASRNYNHEYCMVYGINWRGRWAGVYCAMVVQ